MDPQRGGSGSRTARVQTRTASDVRTASGRYRELRKDDLLSSILGDTADQAAAEEAALSAALEKKQRAQEARHDADERARREAVQVSVREEQRRREEGRAVRDAVARSIEEEELRASGLWSRVDEQRRREAPNTDELAVLSDAALRAAAHREEFRHTELAQPDRRRTVLWGGAIAAGIVACGVVLGLVAAGAPALDPATYARTAVPVLEVASPMVQVSLLQRAEQRSSRESRRTRDGEAADRREPRPHSTEAPSDARTPLPITLDASGIFDRGSEL